MRSVSIVLIGLFATTIQGFAEDLGNPDIVFDTASNILESPAAIWVSRLNDYMRATENPIVVEFRGNFFGAKFRQIPLGPSGIPKIFPDRIVDTDQLVVQIFKSDCVVNQKNIELEELSGIFERFSKGAEISGSTGVLILRVGPNTSLANVASLIELANHSNLYQFVFLPQ